MSLAKAKGMKSDEKVWEKTKKDMIGEILNTFRMSLLVSGSTTYDYLMQHDGRFADGFSAGAKGFSLSYHLSGLEKYPGGTGYNICHTLGLLGAENTLLTGVGHDYSFTGEYSERTDLSNVVYDEELMTASAFIATDSDENQANTFFPGAMDSALETDFDRLSEPSYCIISPNGSVMLPHLRSCVQRGWKTFFDPGQGIGFLSKEDLVEGVQKADYLIVNAYEYNFLQEKTGLTEKDIQASCEMVVVTRSENGVDLISGDNMEHVPAIPDIQIANPTGAGDAFRAGLLFGLDQGLDWTTSAKIGSTAATFCVETMGSASYTFSMDELRHRYESFYGAFPI